VAKLARIRNALSEYIDMLLDEKMAMRKLGRETAIRGEQQAWQTALGKAGETTVMGAIRAHELATGEDVPKGVQKVAEKLRTPHQAFLARQSKEWGEKPYGTMAPTDTAMSGLTRQMELLYPELKFSEMASPLRAEMREQHATTRKEKETTKAAELGFQDITRTKYGLGPTGQPDTWEVTQPMSKLFMARNPELMEQFQSIGPMKAYTASLIARQQAQATELAKYSPESIEGRAKLEAAIYAARQGVNFSPEQMKRLVTLERQKREASLDGETASKVKNMDDNELLAEIMSGASERGNLLARYGDPEIVDMIEQYELTIKEAGARGTALGGADPRVTEALRMQGMILEGVGILAQAQGPVLEAIKKVEEAKQLGATTQEVIAAKQDLRIAVEEGALRGQSTTRALEFITAITDTKLRATAAVEFDSALVLQEAEKEFALSKARRAGVNEADLQHIQDNWQVLINYAGQEAFVKSQTQKQADDIREAKNASWPMVAQIREAGEAWNALAPKLKDWLGKGGAGAGVADRVSEMVRNQQTGADLREGLTGGAFQAAWNAAFFALLEGSPGMYADLKENIPEMRKYIELRGAYQPTLARYFGQRGNLTELEQENAALMLPNIYDVIDPSGQSGSKKFARLIGGVLATPELISLTGTLQLVWDPSVIAPSEEDAAALTEGGGGWFTGFDAPRGLDLMDDIAAIVDQYELKVLSEYQLGQTDGEWTANKNLYRDTYAAGTTGTTRSGFNPATGRPWGDR
jgi:hypothetical protein